MPCPILALDKQVGELMKILEENGQSDNTLVLFHSEHDCSLPYPVRSARDKRYKLIRNLAHAKIKQRLSAQLADWMRQQGDKGLETELKARRGH